MLRHGIEALIAIAVAAATLCGCATIESLGSLATESSRAQDWPKGLTVGNGDVVAARRTQQGHVVIRVVEKREDSGDCFYEDRGGGDRNFRGAMFCHSLGREGWRWVNERYFVKLPPKQD